jgi:hypothetical protein
MTTNVMCKQNKHVLYINVQHSYAANQSQMRNSKKAVARLSVNCLICAKSISFQNPVNGSGLPFSEFGLLQSLLSVNAEIAANPMP